MKQGILLLFIVGLLTSLHAAPKPRKNVAHSIHEPKVLQVAPGDQRVFEFQADDISLVLRTLARQANINLVIDNRIVGTVTTRLQNVTPREALDIIATHKDLIVDEKNGVFVVRPKNPPTASEPEASELEKSLEEAFTEMLTPALTKLYESLLDYQMRPETAQKIAKSKKALYDALLAEGFTKDEAFRIILTNQELALPNLNK